jgi:hypothetical protein
MRLLLRFILRFILRVIERRDMHSSAAVRQGVWSTRVALRGLMAWLHDLPPMAEMIWPLPTTGLQEWTPARYARYGDT